jgi:hypothetical protein
MWPKDRRAELSKLQEMFDIAKQINQGSGAIERLQRVIELSGELSSHDYDQDRPSFTQFLVEQATQPDNK